MKNIVRFALFSATATIAFPAAAQDAAPMAPATAAADSSGLDDIIVTATRRDERLQQVPISITAVGGPQLAKAGISNTLQLTQTIPSLNLRYVNVAIQPIIRGIGTRGTTAGDESNVAVYVDGVYQVDQASAQFDLMNIERVEVLRGPQGTLFGRNATGGLINFITKDPSHEDSAKLEIRYGRFQERSAQAYITGGLSEKVAFDIAAKAYKDNGFVKNLVNGETVGDRHVYSGRVRLKADVTENFTMKGTISYMDLSDSSTVYSQPLGGNTTARSLANDPRTIVTTKPFTTANTAPQLALARSLQTNLDMKLELGSFTLQNTSSYQRIRLDVGLDADLTPFFLSTNDTNLYGSGSYQNEFRFLSNFDGNLNFVAGTYYMKAKFFTGPIVSQTVVAGVNNVSIIDAHPETEAYAGFAEGTWASNGWKLIAGLRWSHEKRIQNGTIERNGVIISRATNLKNTSSKATYRVILSRDIGDIGNVYASYSRGFKSGVFNGSAPSATQKAVDPEVLDAFEIGAKTDPTSWLRVNASAFLYKYKGIQLSSRDPIIGQVVLFNASDSDIKGGEIEATARLAKGLNVRAYATYLDAKYKDFPGAQIFIPAFQDQRSIGGSQFTPIGNSSLVADMSGRDLIRAPKYTIGGSFDYTYETDGGDFGVTANVFHSAKFYWDVNNRTSQPSYTMVNGEISWTTRDGKLKFAIWGNNLTDELVQAQVNPSALSDGVSYVKPRTYGVSATLSL